MQELIEPLECKQPDKSYLFVMEDNNCRMCYGWNICLQSALANMKKIEHDLKRGFLDVVGSDKPKITSVKTV